MRVLVSEGDESLRGRAPATVKQFWDLSNRKWTGSHRSYGHKRQTEALRSSHAADILASNRKRRN